MNDMVYGARAPLWASLGLAVLVALFAAGCAVESGFVSHEDMPVLRDLSWSPDAGCTWTTADDAAVMTASALWAEIGITVMRDDASPDATICVDDVAPRPGYAGWATEDHIDVVRDSATARVLTHEIGHLVMSTEPADDHLPTGARGVLAAATTRCAGCGWSDDDLQHLASYGRL